MVCSICHQSGHNRRTCPQRLRQTNENPPPQTPDQGANQGADQGVDPGHPLVRQRDERRREERRREERRREERRREERRREERRREGRRRRPAAGDRPNPRRLFEVPTIPDLKRYY